MKLRSKGICILAGAGPGDIGLVTLRTKEAVEQAGVIVRDYLCITPRFLNRRRRKQELSLTFVPVMDKIVSNLCRYHNLITLVTKSLCNQLFAQAVPVCVGCIVECYSEIEGFPHQIDGLLLSEAAPPSCRHSPHAKSNLAHGKIGISISAIFHCVSFTM